MELHIVLCKFFNFRLTLTTKNITNRRQQFHHYTIHNMMPLNKHISIIRIYSQLSELLFHCLYLSYRFGMTMLQLLQFPPYTTAHIFQTALGPVNTYLIQLDKRTKIKQ